MIRSFATDEVAKVLYVYTGYVAKIRKKNFIPVIKLNFQFNYCLLTASLSVYMYKSLATDEVAKVLYM